MKNSFILLHSDFKCSLFLNLKVTLGDLGLKYLKILKIQSNTPRLKSPLGDLGVKICEE
jgi:hypothetical protein